MKLPRFPLNADDFKALRDEVAGTPEGGAAAFIVALKLFSDNPEEGIQCLIMQREINDLVQSNQAQAYKGYSLSSSELSLLKSQLNRQKYIPDSYFMGATPENNYAVPEGSWEFDITTNPYSGDPNSGKVKLFVRSSGADTARPVQMMRNEQGIWKVKEYSSLIVGIRKAAQETRQDNL